MTPPKNFTLSGYTTTLDCLSAKYPFDISIRSLLRFCDEVVVVDSGSTDGTLEALQQMAAQDSRLKIFVEPVDFNHPRWAIHNDGYLKGKARAKCQGDFLWQMDVDEVVPEACLERVPLLPTILGDHSVLMLPMVEFWGSFDKIRSDFFSWKLRFSRNDPRIVHGIPKNLRLYDESGHEYPRPFDSDCCNYIFSDSLEDAPSSVRMPSDYQDLRTFEDPRWDDCFKRSLDLLPHVLHMSWLDIGRKIRHHRAYWHRYQYSMYNLQIEDTAQSNVMFDKPWSEVTDADIAEKVTELKQIGPRSFHKKINRSVIGRTTPYSRPIPADLLNWASSLNLS